MALIVIYAHFRVFIFFSGFLVQYSVLFSCSTESLAIQIMTRFLLCACFVLSWYEKSFLLIFIFSLAVNCILFRHRCKCLCLGKMRYSMAKYVSDRREQSKIFSEDIILFLKLVWISRISGSRFTSSVSFLRYNLFSSSI